MLERAGVLQRPRCYPHPGALPPKYQFVNYYAPARPMERMAHFSTFSLNREPDTTIRIIAGDLNDCPNLAVDRKSVSPGPRPASHATHWRTLIGRITYSVIDTIRYLHPHARQFSRPHRQKGVIKSWSRIDHILLSEQHAHLLVSGTTFVDAPLSDHRPVSVTIACPSAESSTAVPSLPETSSQLFRVNTRVYADEAFAARIPFIIDASRRSHPLDPLAAFEEAMARLKIASSDHARHLNRQFLTMKAALERRTHELEALPVLDDQKRAEWQDSVSMNKRLILERARQLRIRAHIPELSSEEPLSHTVHARLAGRRTTIKIDALRLADESISTDLVKCLEHIQTPFQSHHTPDDRDVAQVEDARSTLLDPVRSALPRSTKHSDSRFMRPMTQRHSKLLEEPFTADEFVEAIGKTDKGRSPGASGLPYEMYQSSPTVFAELLASTCNEAWTKGALPDSMTSGIVRLLKKPKPDADYTNLKYYRPITLRECSYKLMSKVLVARLNKVLPSVLPPSQHGFMPGRKASDAGSHLSLLLEQIRTLDLADSALLSLDQESAYDLVDHDWIISVFRAIGAPECFLGLLGVIYGSVSLCYIINGYLTGVVHMLCGLGQGDPVSCPIWNVCFQPYLDALVRRKIALDLCAVLLPTRATILTHLAFADDAIVLVSSPAALGLLAGLAVDWRLATNGRSNTAKTTALPLGPGWAQDERTNVVATVRGGEGMTWAGYPVSIDGDLSLFWSSTLNRVKARLAAASARHVPPRARAMYPNSYVTSKVIHLLSFDNPPITFFDAFEQALISFVWQSESFRPVTEKAVFLHRDLGGLGLLSIEDIVRSMAIHFWDCVAHGFKPIWADLARLSWRQTYPDETSIWSTLIASPRRARHARWTKVINVARQNLPHVFPELLQSNEVMVIPPTLPSLHPHGLSDEVRKQLKKYGAIIDLYRRPQTTGEPVHPRPQPDTPLGRLWAAVSARSPIAPLLPQPAPVRTIIVDSQFPRPCTYSFLGTTRPYTIKALRRFINENCYPSMDDGTRLKWPTDLTKAQKHQFWLWLNSQWPTADKKDVHWKLIFGATPTFVLQWHHGHATSDGCPHCGQRDTFMHFFFECEHSLEYWSLVLQLLRVSLGQADEFQSGTVDSPQIMLGLPRVRGGDRNSRTYIVVRVVLAIAFNKLYLARWHRHKNQIPLLACSRDGELLEQLM
ncbi:BQ2448_8049 [Microbotryum intermedium]|uniref:BQ2448_8049 protein n=1 Tax=Microbotryum intermedium TaxID=269621 RepID=A0A238FMN2_9BASI|nr:BQ2448_8049 [Microbotryum intermedium]